MSRNAGPRGKKVFLAEQTEAAKALRQGSAGTRKKEEAQKLAKLCRGPHGPCEDSGPLLEFPGEPTQILE